MSGRLSICAIPASMIACATLITLAIEEEEEGEEEKER